MLVMRFEIVQVRRKRIGSQPSADTTWRITIAANPFSHGLCIMQETQSGTHLSQSHLSLFVGGFWLSHVCDSCK